MKKSYLNVLIALLFLFAVSCSFGQFKESIDKGAKIYALVSDNTDLIKRMYDQIEKTENAFNAYQQNRNIFTERELLEETGRLYYISLELRMFLKDLGHTLKEKK